MALRLTVQDAMEALELTFESAQKFVTEVFGTQAVLIGFAPGAVTPEPGANPESVFAKMSMLVMTDRDFIVFKFDRAKPLSIGGQYIGRSADSTLAFGKALNAFGRHIVSHTAAFGPAEDPAL